MENTNELSLKIQATCEEALKSLDKLISTMTKVDNAFSKTLKTASKDTISETARNAGKEVDNMRVKTDKAYKSFLKLFTFAGAKSIFNTGLKWMDASMDYSEALNLFNVVLGESTSKATKFQNTMNEAFGTNMTETLNRQGLFQSMAENMGISSDYAYIMSENATKLVNDISSLYNKNENTVAEALRAGVYAGQTKPLRSFGMDITEKTLQPELERLGIDRTVRELSQAEKQLLRYIAVLRQSESAHGDWANTIEAPANQIKIFKNQIVEAQRALANLFMGTFAKILPYANALLMVIKEVANAIASMFGIEISDYNTSIATTEDAYIDFGDSIDEASKKAKELNKQILGFDQINNINENKNSGSGYDVSGGIDQRLLDAIHGYDNGMDKVRMKATEIRDRIMEWLGFTKEIDPITGKTSFTYEGMTKTLSNMWESFKGLSTEGKILMGLGLVTGANKLFNVGKKLTKAFGTTGLGKVLKTIISPTKSLIQWAKLGVKVNGNLIKGLKDGVEAWRDENILVKKADGSLNKFQTTINGATTALGGLVEGAVGLAMVRDAVSSISDEGLNLINSLELLGGTFSTVMGGVQIGAIFGPWGAVIGGAIGLLADLGVAIATYETDNEKMIKSAEATYEAHKKYNDELRAQKTAIEESMINGLAQTTYHQNLLEELKQIVDANGKVKEGYESRANFIVTELNKAYGTEMEIINGTIKGYKEEIGSIQELIETKKANILLQANEEAYTRAVEEQAKAWKRAQESLEEFNKTNEEANELRDKLAEAEELLGTKQLKNFEYVNEQGKKFKGYNAYLKLKEDLKAYDETLKNNWKTYEEDSSLYKQYTEDIVRYEQLSTAILLEDKEKLKKALEDYTNSVVIEGEKQKMSQSELLEFYKRNGDETINYLKTQGVEITKEVQNMAYANYNTVLESLIKQTKTVKEMTPEMVDAWGTLATESEDKFLECFGKLPKDIQKEVVDKMKEKGLSISEELEKGIQQKNPKIKFDADTSKAKSSLEGFLERNVSAFSAIGMALPVFKFADGGFPQTGQMFLAREAGPELVGRIGRKTAVANNEQIVQAVSNGVYNAVASAMSNVGGGSTVVDLNIRTEEGIIVEKAVKGIQQHVAQTGELPFTVPA